MRASGQKPCGNRAIRRGFVRSDTISIGSAVAINDVGSGRALTTAGAGVPVSRHMTRSVYGCGDVELERWDEHLHNSRVFAGTFWR